MKLTVFFILISVFSVLAGKSYSQTKTLTLHMENVKVKEALAEIENQSEFRIMYSGKFVDVERQVSLDVKNQKIGAVLDLLFAGTDVGYTVKDRFIVLVTPELLNEGSITVSQQRAVSGKVTDESGQPLPGVTVVVKGTTQGTVTNADGEYNLTNLPEGATLVFSFVGMRSQEVVVGNQTRIDVSLVEDVIGIEEVVAIGYGTMKKSDLTGSVASISSKSFLDQPASSINSVLLGRASGVTVRRSNGAPGEGAVIRIRGANSLLGSNDPLIVVDGNYSGMPDMYEIESIEILKDASATAIYGSRGANGVILVQTKRGTQGKPTGKLYSDVSFNNQSKRYDLMDAYEFAEFNNRVGAYPFTDEELANFKANGGVDWQDEIFRTGLSQNYKAVFSGGTNNIRYYVSPNYSKSTGTIRNTEASGYGLNAKLDMDLSKRISIQIESRLGHSGNLNPGMARGGSKIEIPLTSSLIWAPTEPIYNEDGTFNRLGAGSGSAPNPRLLTDEIQDTNYSNNGSGVGNLKIKIIEGLILDAKGSISIGTGGNRYFESGQYTGVSAGASQSSYESKSWLVNTLLTYSKIFADVHNVSAMVGMEETKSESQSISAKAIKLPIESVSWYNLGLGAPNISIGSGWGNSAMRSYFGRLNYNYASRYYLTVNSRSDGSSKFRGDNQFSNFPSFSLAWRPSEESFMKSQHLFQNLKIRGGWGVTGSQAIGTYATFSPLRSYSYTWGSVNQPGYEASVGGNPDLKWESTEQTNFGIDLTTLGSRLSLSLDYYYKKTKDLLAPVSVPAYNGGGSVITNVGSVNNKGFEFNVSYDVLRTKDWLYDLNINGALNRNKVVDIGEQDFLYGSTYGDSFGESPFVLMPGHPIGSIYGFKYLGIWQKNEAEEAAKFEQEPGDYKYEDLNGNYNYDSDDKQIIGSSNPSFTWGFNNHLSYKNFDFNILFEGVHGRDVMNWSYLLVTERIDLAQLYNLHAAKDRWAPDNPDAKFAKIGNSNRLTHLSTQFVENGSYVKLRNLSLGYRIPRSVISFATIKLSASAQNILTFTNYKGFDPEISSSSGDANSGMDWFAYPNPMSLSFGISIEY